MECPKQSYWSWEFYESKYIYCDTKANLNYTRFAKRQYHKARRRYDEKLIQEGIRDYRITQRENNLD